jgi:hypothetical protein
MMDPPTQPSGLKFIKSPLKPLEGIRTSWQTTNQSSFHHQLGPGSWGSPHDLSIHGQTCVFGSSVTFGPPVSDQESIGT